MSSLKRKQFSLEEKKKIIDEVDSGMKKGDVSRKHGITPSTLSTFLKDRHKIELQLQQPLMGPKRKRIRQPQLQDVDSAVFTWFQDMRSRNVAINGPLIREKALQFATTLGHEHFQASVGWLNRFRERYGIVAKFICGEAGDTPMESVMEWRAGEVTKLISSYSPDDVFNADEAGIFFQLEPNKTLALKGDKCVGGKKSKQRITALFCCNKSGTEKRKVLIVGKSAKPRCMKNVHSLPCEYTWSKKAWMTTPIFSNWLVKFNAEMKRKNRKIILLIDNCTPHNETPKLDCIRVEYFPPNCTAVLQPLDQGIIKAVKTRYRALLMKHILQGIDRNEETKTNVKEAMEMIAGAWGDVSQTTIVKCWGHAAINNFDTTDAEDDLEEVVPLAELKKLWNSIANSTSVPDNVELNDFLFADDGLLTSYELTDTDIIQSITDNKTEENASSSDEEDTSNPVPNVSASEALSCLETVRNFVNSQKNVPDDIFSHVHSLQNFLISNATNKLVQTKITDFV